MSVFYAVMILPKYIDFFQDILLEMMTGICVAVINDERFVCVQLMEGW